LSFGRKLSHNSIEEGTYRDFAILNHIPVQDFVDQVVGAPPEFQSLTLAAFKSRFERINVQPELKRELKWLDEVSEALMKKSEGLASPTKFRLQQGLQNYVAPIIGYARSSGDL
jgi:hypothetical protein